MPKSVWIAVAATALLSAGAPAGPLAPVSRPQISAPVMLVRSMAGGGMGGTAGGGMSAMAGGGMSGMAGGTPAGGRSDAGADPARPCVNAHNQRSNSAQPGASRKQASCINATGHQEKAN